jgi:glutaminyl-peptide cyclotransferase
MKKIVFSILLFAIISCKTKDRPEESNESGSETKTATPAINYAVTKVYPHDTTAFTEGLLVHDSQLYESTGSPNEMAQTKSLFGPVDLKTGVINKKVELDKQKYFGEGIVFLDGKVFQLTYQTKKGFVYDAKSFQKIGEFTYPSKEGWGLTTDGRSLIMSDGTSNLTYLNPVTFQPSKTLQVTDENGPVSNLNELEFIGGALYANVYTTPLLVRIDTSIGKVTGKLDLSSLANEAKVKYPAAMEMNGVAYDSASHKVYVTGKMWPNIYEINFNH